MVLESTIVCLDNSEFSRNGDFAPSRYMAQVDLVNMLCSSKINANPESTVGLLSMAGRSARILVTSTRDPGQLFSCMHDVKFDGTTDVLAGIQKAQLALKHRQNTMQRQRIVVFVLSPINAPTEKLVQLAKKLKKNNVAIDIVNLGDEADNESKIDTLIGAVNANDNSHALHLAAGTGNAAERFRSSPVCLDRDAAAAAGGSGAGGGDGGGANDFPFGVDPAQDPELAMVLRISMEEERLRQEAANRTENADAGGDASGANASASSAQNNNADAEYDDDDDLYTSGSGQKDKMDVVTLVRRLGHRARLLLIRRSMRMMRWMRKLDA
eukprot:IDg16396t1